MDAVKNDVKRLVKIELAAANRKFRMFASNHEGVAVIQKEAVEAAAGALTCCYDCVFSNSKSPIGTQAVVVTDNAVCALTQEEKADKTLFETSLRDFLKNEKLNKEDSFSFAILVA